MYSTALSALQAIKSCIFIIVLNAKWRTLKLLAFLATCSVRHSTCIFWLRLHVSASIEFENTFRDPVTGEPLYKESARCLQRIFINQGRLALMYCNRRILFMMTQYCTVPTRCLHAKVGLFKSFESRHECLLRYLLSNLTPLVFTAWDCPNRPNSTSPLFPSLSRGIANPLSPLESGLLCWGHYIVYCLYVRTKC